MAAAQFEALEASEVDAVRRWRFDELVRAGYEDEDALELAFHLDVDLHVATNLVRRGCPSSTAVRIALYARPVNRFCAAFPERELEQARWESRSRVRLTAWKTGRSLTPTTTALRSAQPAASRWVSPSARTGQRDTSASNAASGGRHCGGISALGTDCRPPNICGVGIWRAIIR